MAKGKRLDLNRLDKLVSSDITASTRPRQPVTEADQRRKAETPAPSPAESVPGPQAEEAQPEQPEMDVDAPGTAAPKTVAKSKKKKPKARKQAPSTPVETTDWQRTSMMLPVGMSAEVDIAIGKARALTGKRGNKLNKSKLIAAAIRLAVRDLEENGLKSVVLEEISSI